MDRKLKSNQSIMHGFDEETQTHWFDVVGYPRLLLPDSSISPENSKRSKHFGLRQVRVVDGAAIGKTDREGNIIPEAVRLKMKYEGMRRIVEHLASGSPDWELPRAGGVRAAPKQDSLELILQAIMRATGRDADGVGKMLAEMVRQRGGDLEANARYLAESKRVLVALAEIRAESARPAGGENPDDVLDAMLGE